MSNKEKIFEVSINLFSQYGYDGVSVRQIASEVGIKESSIYNHFKSKESIMDAILDYYIDEMTSEEIPLTEAGSNMDVGFDYFYRQGLDVYKSKLSEDRMMKITRIILIESYHNEKIRNFIKTEIIGYAIEGWVELFELMKRKMLIEPDCDSKQLAESFYYFGLFLLIKHFIINYPEDDEEFLKELGVKSENHMKLLFNSVKLDFNIRLEEERDYFEVENMVRNAFWNIYRPGAFEHYIVHELRNDESFIRDLAYVIEKDNEIIGHINYSNGKIIFENGKTENAIILGPVSIAEKFQNHGYGSKLITHTLQIIEEKKIPYVFVVGSEDYYHRFGFKSASEYGIYLEGTDTNDECPFFMVKLFDGKTDLKPATFSNPEVFNVDEKDVDEFDKKFEYKEKKIQEGQLEMEQ